MTFSRFLAFALVAATAVVAGCATNTGDEGSESKEEVDISEAKISLQTASLLGKISTLGEPLTAFYTPPTRGAWSFAARGGDIINVSVRSQIGDSVAFLTDERWNVLAWNDDAEPGTHDARIRYAVPSGAAPSNYRIAFSDYQMLPAEFTTTVSVTPSSTCTYESKVYSMGQKFQASDGCNTCTCGTDGVECTKSACTCSKADPTYHYVAGPEQCESIGWQCRPGQVRFSNACGCGCKDL